MNLLNSMDLLNFIHPLFPTVSSSMLHQLDGTKLQKKNIDVAKLKELGKKALCVEYN